MPSAVVLDLATFLPANRFTLCDRMELSRWSDIAHARGDTRLVLHERLEGDPSDVGNYVAVYPAGDSWAAWGLSRRPGGIVVWDSVTGLDKGRFASMHEALSWVMEQKSDPAPGRACRPSSMEAKHSPVRLLRGS